ncbi:glycosyltransferase family 9 protein [Dyadobacter sp. CY356]|uniref:glycosyltransferase family 9 protein n=1 Tax=Dyadobacter sp. CY356 TaxID=2906442 RepID=UPI001F43CD82|nr:glycosyltransferase family 9 protein [Dyadobacter sp. CY356]MCF0056454.1 glycosyltransferase family 9 protein [Dyadobacter sp. CY356]
MTIERFRQLWTHRYFKYSHILKAHFLAFQAYTYFKTKKAKFEKGKELIAIVRTEHFGDIVAAEPISRYVRSLHPNAHIVWFVKPTYHELIDFNPAVDETFGEFCVTQRRILFEKNVFDKIYPLQFSNNNHCAKCQVTIDNPIAERKGINVSTYFNFGNLLEVFAQTAGLVSSELPFPADDQPRLYLQDQHRQKADSLNLPERFIVIHCQSNYAPKDWPAERWDQLVGWISETYSYKIVEIGLKSNLSTKESGYRNLCGQLSILETAEVIKRADFFIGLDSGPSHLANAVSTTGVILMGSLGAFPSYNPYSGSYGRQENAFFVRQDGKMCAELSFEFVKEKVASVLDKTILKREL